MHFLAAAIVSHEKSTLAGNATIVIVCFATRNDALVVLKDERFEALKASMVLLL